MRDIDDLEANKSSLKRQEKNIYMTKHPFKNDEGVMLLDISSNKKWIAYVTQSKEESDKQNKKPQFYITRRRFDEVTREKSLMENKEEIPISAFHSTFNITSILEVAKNPHCKFLSISSDGKYIVLSFFERSVKSGFSYWSPKNPKCLVFVVVNDKNLSIFCKLKCNGRAVFLDKNEGYSLAIVNSNAVEVYAEFPNVTSASYLLDLSRFRSGKENHEDFQSDETYINSASWADTEHIDENQEIRRVLLLTRHIRYSILTTHFAGGIARVWSIKDDGVLYTSFPAIGQHIMAFSKDYKYTATYVTETRSINIFNVKSGLRVYTLERQQNTNEFTVSHIRFCYDGRYIAMSGMEGDNVVFEVWYIDAEKSIYRTSQFIGLHQPSKHQRNFVHPFVTRGEKEGAKCLMGICTIIDKNKKLATKIFYLDIDNNSDRSEIEWSQNESLYYGIQHEIYNNLNDMDKLYCGHIQMNEKKYLIRFGLHTVQLWKLSNPDGSKEEPISNNDELIYIRAYKGPAYGVNYSFRENWRIHKFKSIRFMGDMSSGRIIVNITEPENTDESSYHTEELFLPFQECMISTSIEQSTSTARNTPRRFNYHKLESACQALHYLTFFKQQPEQTKTNYDMLLNKTMHLVNSSVASINEQSNFFSTIAGSRTLAMLASFKAGVNVIKAIFAKNIPISIFSYTKTVVIPKMSEDEEFWNHIRNIISTKLKKTFLRGLTEGDERSEYNNQNQSSIDSQSPTYRSSLPKPIPIQKCFQESIAGNENVLTVLIEELEYDLYKLLFNRILSDSKNLGPGCLSALMDALLFLQEEGNSDLLLASSHKLSFLEINKNKLGVLQSEFNQTIKVKGLQKEYVSSFRNLESHAMMEQIKKYSGLRLLVHRLKTSIRTERVNNIIHIFHLCWKRSVVYVWKKSFKEARKDSKGSSRLCVVPLPHFNTYNNLPEDRPTISNGGNIRNYKKSSAFVRVAIEQNSNNIFQQGDTVLEVMLQYKWKEFARWRFAWICAIHALYYVSYSTGVLFSQELYEHDPDQEFRFTDPRQIASISLMCIAVFILIVQEARQFFKMHSKVEYFFSGYNWIDLAAFIFPIFTLIQLRFGIDYFNEVCSASTLILWTHGILRLRVISYFGITLETIIQLCKNVTSVLFIMLLVILAFTQAYIVLLRLEPDEYFQENYEGSYQSLDNNSTEGDIAFANVSADNGFRNWFKAFSQVWFFVYGVWDPLNEGDAGDNKFLMCLSILFSLITVLIFFNLVIALMASTVEEVKKRGKKVWVSHFAAVVSEIEYLWCLSDAKHNRMNNPSYIYYIASEDSVIKHVDGLKKETEELMKKMKINIDKNIVNSP